MKLNTRITGEALRHHFAYNAWKYVLLVILSFFGWNLIYTSTAYRPPQDKRVDLYIQSATTTSEIVDPFIEKLWKESVPDMELVSSVLLQMGAEEDMYSIMQLTTYIAAQEGDIYMLGSNDFKRFASQEAFLQLEDLVAEGAINAEGLDLSAGYVTVVESDNETLQPVQTSIRHLYGIPAAELFGFMTELNIDNRDKYLAVTANNGNDENVIKFLNALIQATRGEAPEWLTQTQAPQ